MKPKILAMLLMGVFGYSQNAMEIIKKADENRQGKSSQGVIKMEIIRPTWKRTIKMKTWSKGRDYNMTYIIAPIKDKGSVFMKKKTEMWNWLPSINRMMKIPSSMMSQGWMGSDLTNDDILKESSIVLDYTHKMLGEEKINGYDCYKIEMTPKEDAVVVWGKVMKWISKKHFLQMKTEYYDEDEELVKSEIGNKVKKMGDRYIPSVTEIIPADEEGKKTIFIIESMKFNTQKLNTRFFTQQKMKRIR